MRCREAREKLITLTGSVAGDEEDKALREHIKQCADCAKLALAERLLRGDIEQLRDVKPSHPMTIEQVRQGIAIREKRHRNASLGERIMRQTTDTIYARPRLSLGIAAAFIMLLASVVVPVRTERTIGYQVAFAAPATGLILHQQDAERMLMALDINDAKVNVRRSRNGIEYSIAPLANTVQVQRLIAALNSLGGGGSQRVLATAQPGEKRTIWELLLDYDPDSSPSSSENIYISLDDFDDLPQDDFMLWLPVEDQPDDSMAGILIDRQGEKTNIWPVGLEMEPDSRGWNPMLNGNTVMKLETPEGDMVEFDFTNIDDVRKLEKMGYNFWLMEFDTPGQVPIPGMGPQLHKIEPDRFTDDVVISFMIPQASDVQVHMLDERKRVVRALQNTIVLAGIHSVVWDGRDTEGDRVEPGTYICRFVAGDYMEIQKVVLRR